MSEYYGITTPTSDFIAHYGIKGMKWGVRRAIEKGNKKALERHYRRAQRKLRKLDWKANPKEQEKYANIENKVSKNSLKIGLGALGIATGSHAGYQLLKKRYNKAYNEFYYPGWDKDAISRGKLFSSGDKDMYDALHAERVLQANKMQNAANDLTKYGNIAIDVKNVSGKIGGIALGIAAGSKVSAKNAQWRASPKGHAKMVANRNAWRNQMLDAFKDTQYKNLPKLNKKRRIQNG